MKIRFRRSPYSCSGDLPASGPPAAGVTTVNVAAGSHLDGGLFFIGDLAAQTLNLGDNVTVAKGLACKPGAGGDAITIGNGGNVGGNLSLWGNPFNFLGMFASFRSYVNSNNR